MTTVWVGPGGSPPPRRSGGIVGEDPIDAPRGRFVVDGSRVRLIGESRPGRTWVHRLSEGEFRGRPGILDGLQIVGAHRFGHIAENRLGVLPERSGRSPRHQQSPQSRAVRELTDFLSIGTSSSRSFWEQKVSSGARPIPQPKRAMVAGRWMLRDFIPRRRSLSTQSFNRKTDVCCA